MLITNVSLPHVNRLAASHAPAWRYGGRVFLVADTGKKYGINRDIERSRLHSMLQTPCKSFRHYSLQSIEQQQTEKIQTEVRDVDRIRIMKVYTLAV
jgi:hypothetical protein